MAKLEIQIQTRKMLKPSISTPNHLRILKLSFFDHLVPRVYVPVLFHYLPSSTGEGTITERCDKLQKSLAQTLTGFYPMAGRFTEDEFSIQCNDEGVEYVETKVNADLAEFLYQLGPKTELLNDFLPWPSSSVSPYSDLPSSPLLGVQVNIFNCGGLVIAIQISHILADAFTYATFLNEWANTSLTGTTKDCLPSFGHLSSLFPTRALSGPQFSPPSNRGPKSITRRFVFDALAITKLKNTIEGSSAIRPTRVVVVMSLIWKILVGISTAKNGHSRDSSFLFPINLRGKSILPSLEHALGNFTMFGIANLEASQSRKELNVLVGNTIRDTCLGIGKAASVNDISSLVVNNQIKVVDKLSQGDEMDIYSCSSWCGFPWYEADFGWGKPFWVSSISFDAFEVIVLMDTKNGDGVEAWVSLKENDMTEFERDADILTFCPPLLP
ncbi:acetyl-CoA-benzylalcohol acetyltransferase-like [Solanum dulcamara]|uniref:acetyl-CoA-benzylalcohol acetyltransferase-like n=1 Tax=Solanum dulcamara TaxID=45834 RepID=UPI0024858CD3|nr:acetyl-CoA-benzylalcohol acetyltransferase-like [Solanum dulcamara]